MSFRVARSLTVLPGAKARDPESQQADASARAEQARHRGRMNYNGTARPGLTTDRWEVLFADLECQLEAERQATRSNEVAELARAEAASVGFEERLLGSVGKRLTFHLCNTDRVSGLVVEATAKWARVAETTGSREHLVPAEAICAMAGPSAPPRPIGSPLDRLGLGSPLQRWMRDRSVVVVHAGSAEFAGRLRSVGADFLELPARGHGAPAVIVPFARIARVTRCG